MDFKLFNADALAFDYAGLGPIDAVVSDPPYNINFNSSYFDRYIRGRNPMIRNSFWCEKVKDNPPKNYESIESMDLLDYSFLFDLKIFRMALFGLQNYIEFIPLELYKAGSFCVWDKRSNSRGRVISDNMLGSEFELIWFYPKMKYKFIRYVFAGVFGTEKEDIKRRVHPTQKPVAVMIQCLRFLKLKPGAVVIDPFMGSGSTGCACAALGYNFIGIEKNENYFSLAAARIKGWYDRYKGALFDFNTPITDIDEYD